MHKAQFNCITMLTTYDSSFQLKYKRRVYKMLNLDEKQLKALHTRTNLRRLIEYVNNGQVEKITKMCSKGLDPNFHCQETGGKFFYFGNKPLEFNFICISNRNPIITSYWY